MKTRTLLLLAVASGLVILVAGSIKLFLIAEEEQPAHRAIGASGQAGDMTVTVDAASAVEGDLYVSVNLVGADDPDGAQSWVFVTAGQQVRPVAPPASIGPACEATRATESVDCVLAFRTDSTLGVLKYERGDETIIWDITAEG